MVKKAVRISTLSKEALSLKLFEPQLKVRSQAGYLPDRLQGVKSIFNNRPGIKPPQF